MSDLPFKIKIDGDDIAQQSDYTIWFGKTHNRTLTIQNLTNHTLEDFVIQTNPKIKITQPKNLNAKEDQNLTLTIDGSEFFNNETKKIKLHIRCTETV